MKAVFFGTPHFAAELFDFLATCKEVELSAVVTMADKPRGRTSRLLPSPVKETALQYNPSIPIFQPAKTKEPQFLEQLRAIEADIFLVVAYGAILSDAVLAMPPRGCINVHPSLLPKYRGAAPIQRAIMSGDLETAVSIMYLVKKLDAGDLIAQEIVAIGEDETCGELSTRLCDVSKKALLQAIKKIADGQVEAACQDEEQVTYAHKIDKEECQIDWNQPVETLHNKIRALAPQPGAWCYATVQGVQKKMKLLRTHIPVANSFSPLLPQPGTLLPSIKEGMFVSCADGVLEIVEVQLEGKKVMAVADFFRGIPKDAFS
ncbi:methionyl-tRNA formyltransferase, partial [Simkania negevensis]|nr:methionyl-tRNA formyltransferase [Simkania negevensis]